MRHRWELTALVSQAFASCLYCTANIIPKTCKQMRHHQDQPGGICNSLTDTSWPLQTKTILQACNLLRPLCFRTCTSSSLLPVFWSRIPLSEFCGSQVKRETDWWNNCIMFFSLVLVVCRSSVDWFLGQEGKPQLIYLHFHDLLILKWLRFLFFSGFTTPDKPETPVGTYLGSFSPSNHHEY